MARQFGASWWGQAWLEALEERALVDPNRLPRGRTYARQDRVRHVEMSPGLIRADVDGTERYVAQLGVRRLTDTAWQEVLERILGRVAVSAGLLSGELPRELADLLLPGAGDLSPDCSCPDWAEPCKHAAALCYVVADLFDEDPFGLLLVRGRSRDEVLTEVRERRAVAIGVDAGPPSDLPRGADPGESGTAAWRRDATPFARSVPGPRAPGQLPALAHAPPAGSGVEERDLRRLVADAAHRAWEMLGGDAPSHLALPTGLDVIRRAAGGDPAQIAVATGVDETELRAAVVAWQLGGADAVRVLRHRWDPPEDAMTPAATLMGPDARTRRNAVSVGREQLRLDERHRWWRFDADDALGWVVVNGPATDPADL